MTRIQKILLIAIIIISAFYRVDFLQAINMGIDADEAIVGLMAKHIKEGRGIPVFYYGQNYMGSLESILVSFSFHIFGISNLALKFVPLLFSVLFVFLIFKITSRLWSVRAGLFAACLCAFPQLALLEWSTKARGGFIEILVIGACSYIVLIEWLHKPSLKRLALLGFILGVGWWVNNQIIFFMVTSAFFVLARLLYLDCCFRLKMESLFASISVGAVAFILGGLPFWIFNVTHNFVSFDMFQAGTNEEIKKHVSKFLSVSLPILLGGKRFWQETDYFYNSTFFVSLIYGIGLLVFIRIRVASLLRLVVLRIDREKPVEILIFHFLACGVIFIISSFGYLYEAPRYLLPMYVSVFPISGIVIDWCWARYKLVGSVFFAAMLIVNFMTAFSGGRSIPGEPVVFMKDRVSRDHSLLIKWLNERKIKWVRTNYWIGYRLAFETGEDIRFVMFQDPRTVRIKEYQKDGESLDVNRLPFILVPSQTARVVKALTALRCEKEVANDISGYDIVYNVKCPKTSAQTLSVPMEARANINVEKAQNAVDGDPNTRWGSAHPQRPDMEFRVLLPHLVRADGIRYSFGKWPHDYPRGLEVELILVDGSRKRVLDNDDYQAIRFLVPDQPDFELFFDETEIKGFILKQQGSDWMFDWSIAEIGLIKK